MALGDRRPLPSGGRKYYKYSYHDTHMSINNKK